MALQRTQEQRPISLTEYAENAIRTMIIEGDLALGQQVSESALAAPLGLSKTPVREALVRLQQDGLVDIHPRRGTFVFLPTREQLGEICQFRSWAEGEALRAAMEHDRPRLIQLMEETIVGMGASLKENDLASYQRWDRKFHLDIVATCNNRYMEQAYSNIESKISALRMRFSLNPERITASYEDHKGILDDIKENQARSAIKTIKRHCIWRKWIFFSIHDSGSAPVSQGDKDGSESAF